MSEPLRLRTRSAEHTRALASALAGVLRAGDLLVLDGPLGAGKTTFTQGLGKALGVRGPVASPTFVISRVHPSLVGGPALVHVDAYRLSGGGEIEDLDLEADLDGAVTVVEWGRDLVEHLAASSLLVELDRTALPDGEDPAVEPPSEAGAEPDPLAEPRLLRLSPTGPRWDRAARAELLAALRSIGLPVTSDDTADHTPDPDPEAS